MCRKIDGTLFEFRHHNTPKGKCWNPARSQELTPEKKTLISPYGTNLVRANDRFIRSLTELDVKFYEDYKKYLEELK